MLKNQNYRVLWLVIPHEATLNSVKQTDAYRFVKWINAEVL